MLTERNRYRLTGTIFLIAVAAVVLPMLFDGEGVVDIELPAVPPADFQVERNQTPPPDMSDALEGRRALKEAIDEDGYAVDTGTRIGEPVLSAPPASTGEREESTETAAPEGANQEDAKWAVQVASFSQVENATAQRDGLLADGYAAFLSNVKRQGEITTRVAVGPLINRRDADQLKEELNRRYQFAAVVVRFSP